MLIRFSKKFFLFALFFYIFAVVFFKWLIMVTFILIALIILCLYSFGDTEGQYLKRIDGRIVKMPPKEGYLYAFLFIALLIYMLFNL